MYKLTIKQRIILSSTGLVFILSVLLLFFVNYIAPGVISNQTGSPDLYILYRVTSSSGESEELKAPPIFFFEPEERKFLFSNIDYLLAIRATSIIGLVITIILSFAGSKWIADFSLQPIRKINEMINEIQADKLGSRLNYSGPDDEIKVLADSFDKMLGRLDNSFIEQSNYSSNLAHELRTPLSNLQLNLEILKSDPSVNIETYKEFNEQVEHSLIKMENLVQNLLLLSRSNYEINQEYIYLEVLFEEIFTDLSLIAEQKNIKLNLISNQEEPIQGDFVLLQQAFSNIIENGIKYNRPNGMVKVLVNQLGENCIICIKDTGQGISDKDMEHIFDRFYRSRESRIEYSSGLGLGLSISSHIIKLHKGNIEVTSEIGEGSTFKITLPIKGNKCKF
ncbi:MAG TPA: HAMP domain-containing sensor histidine kinase [Bacilli bacterium]|jgi:signal transduction histidine kinase|nr:HAMP domain-containing sensor histidine kinase [Bacilli bacterium]